MGQVGLHAITGLVVGEHLLNAYVQDRAGRRALLFGFVVGNIVPDLDFLAVVGMFPVDQEMALHLHRGFTHSLLGSITMWVGFYLGSMMLRDSYMRYLGFGLSLGVVCHFLSDLLLWFSPVDIFWPASIFGLIPPVNLWFWYETPALLGRLMGAAEFIAFAVYYQYLARLARTFETDLEMIPSLERMIGICWIAWAVATGLAFELTDSQFIILSYVPMGVLFMPVAFYVTWRMQKTVEAVATFREPQLPEM